MDALHTQGLAPRPPHGESVPEWRAITQSRPEMNVELLRELTEPKGIPPEIKQLMNSFMSQDVVWGNFKREDEQLFTELFLSAWDFVEYMSTNDISPVLHLKFMNSYFHFRQRLTRGREGFERKQEVTSIAQTVTQPTERRGGFGSGFFKKLGF